MTRRGAIALASAVSLLAGCSAESDTVGSSASSPATTQPTAAEPNGETMRIAIDVEGTTVIGTLNDSVAARDLAALLPVTVEMSDHGGVEKTGPLPAVLSTDGSPSGADPDPGDIGYYAPSNDVVLYYGDQSYFPGIVVLGTMDPSGVGVVGALGGTVTVTITSAD
ncbi:hypothetical protein QE449_003613 [Rhodococcus sp. SORGH_AS303]|nr:hypothetical protein [Rhodococcus sp. SORGH_AS_0303]